MSQQFATSDCARLEDFEWIFRMDQLWQSLPQVAAEFRQKWHY